MRRVIVAGLALGIVLATVQPHPTAAAQDWREKPIWRLQIQLTTANVQNANTNDGVRVELNNSNRTWLNYARDDFERGDTFTYDLNLENATQLGDIEFLRIIKTGDDGWCVDRVTLLVNGRPARSSTVAPCHWLDTSAGRSNTWLVVDTSAMQRALDAYVAPGSVPRRITAREWESRIQGIAGHALRGFDWLRWQQGRVVLVSRADNDQLRMILRLELLGWEGGPVSAQLTYIFQYRCSDGNVSVILIDADLSHAVLVCPQPVIGQRECQEPNWEQVNQKVETMFWDLGKYQEWALQAALDRHLIDNPSATCLSLSAQSNGDLVLW